MDVRSVCVECVWGVNVGCGCADCMCGVGVRSECGEWMWGVDVRGVYAFNVWGTPCMWHTVNGARVEWCSQRRRNSRCC